MSVFVSFGFVRFHGGVVADFNHDGIPEILKISASNGDTKTGVGNWEGLRFSYYGYVDEKFEDIDIREDEKVLRKNIVISVKFSIKRENDDEEIFSGESQISSAYNRVAEPYANFVNEKDTKDRVLLLIIQDIKRQLALFKRNQER